MGLMKGDMGGAACVVSTVMAIAQLECPTSVIGLVPLCENMPAGNAVKPGDVVTAMNGKTIEVCVFEPFLCAHYNIMMQSDTHYTLKHAHTDWQH